MKKENSENIDSKKTINKKNSTIKDKNKKESNQKIKRKNSVVKSEDKKEEEYVKTSVKFNLIEVIIIILITGIITSIISGIIVYNNFDNINDKSNKNNSVQIQQEDFDLFKNVYNKILNDYVEKVDKDELLEAAIRGMYNHLGDSYSMYIDKEDTANFEESLQGEYQGIGIEITSIETEDGVYSVINRVFKDSPAEKSGLKPGDELLELDGESLKNKEISYVANTIKYGEKDTHILKVKRDKEEIEIEVSRTKVFIDYVSSEIMDDNIGYVKLESFGASVTEQMKKELDKFDDNVKSLIIDLRDNTGGYLHIASELSDLFIEKDKNIYQFKDRDGKLTVYKAKSEVYRKFDKIAVIINENSASASEILALALKESANAKIVGVKSYGKGSVQETEVLSTGSMIKHTVAYWFSANGNSINEVGITPDIEEKNVDKQITRAKEAVK